MDSSPTPDEALIEVLSQLKLRAEKGMATNVPDYKEGYVAGLREAFKVVQNVRRSLISGLPPDLRKTNSGGIMRMSQSRKIYFRRESQE